MSPDLQNYNRAILLTAPSPAAIAVIRILGPAVSAFLTNHFSRPTKLHHCVHADLFDESHQVLDDAVIVTHSTGADLNLHGGPWVVRSVLELLSRQGFQILPTSTGTLPPEALDSPLDTIDSEVESHLPIARTDLAVRALLSQPTAWKNLLNNPTPASLHTALNDPSLHHLLHPPRVAIVGTANVGKSTLANQLFSQARSIVADLPGTTRDYIAELANINGLAITLLDTPGQRSTPDPIEQTAISQSTPHIAAADLLLLVLDASRGLDPEQLQMLTRYPAAIIILNKIDKSPSFNLPNAISTIACKGQGLAEVRTAICKFFNCADLDPTQARCWTPRQRTLLTSRVIPNIDSPQTAPAAPPPPTA
ncbi:MAG TPA: GTPase [Tepidisphaeraceae bacterium]|jgi:small GTP-binding protein|nr:GTPase [Tepidisphaeraceae bacterium]